MKHVWGLSVTLQRCLQGFLQATLWGLLNLGINYDVCSLYSDSTHLNVFSVCDSSALLQL